MEQHNLFSILDSVDSTNNYAMARVHEGLAKHGSAVFARHQNAGKGQRGKQWVSNPGDNIILSITVQPSIALEAPHFLFNACIAVQCVTFLQNLTGESFKIKWPNDIFWRDRKAGGILIENVVKGDKWNWSVVGIGINVNQVRFPTVSNAVSLQTITGREYDAIELSQDLHSLIMQALSHDLTDELMDKYNLLLYKKNEEVQLRKDNVVFTTAISHVDRFGNLHTSDAIERSFYFGEVEWVFS